jgi:hypothetical protein
MNKDRALLTTVTGEPFQPVRLYYTIPSKPFVTRILSRLHCIEEERKGGRWVWLYMAEAESLTFAHLTLTLRLRGIRACEHWSGKTHLTLEDIIYRLAEQGVFTPPD